MRNSAISSWRAEIRRREAAEHRDERQAIKLQKELERRLKEQAKLSAYEQARLEVEAYENSLEVLLSIHKEQTAPTDWFKLAAALPPHSPPRLARNELTAVFQHNLSIVFQTEGGSADFEGARSMDWQAYEAAWTEYQRDFVRLEGLRSLAQRVLAGEGRAYTQAAAEFPNLAEISNLGSSIHMTVHDPTLIECTLKVNGWEAIPRETKSLTAAGKITVRAMPKARFHEIYQDYVCGCILRLAREMFSLLPVNTVLLTAIVDCLDSQTGLIVELPVLSMSATRGTVEHLAFERLNPSDALQNFLHRGDVIASRKLDEFLRIVPLTPDDVRSSSPQEGGVNLLLARVEQLKTEFGELQRTRSSANR